MHLMPRRIAVASFGTFAAFSAAFLVANLAAPQWAQAAGLDVWTFDDDRELLRQEQDRQRELVQEHDQLFVQFGAVNAVTQDLLEDRMDFPAAVETVEKIIRHRKSLNEVLILMYPQAHTNRERVAWYVISKIRTRLTEEPSRQADISCRLEATLHEMMAN